MAIKKEFLIREYTKENCRRCKGTGTEKAYTPRGNPVYIYCNDCNGYGSFKKENTREVGSEEMAMELVSLGYTVTAPLEMEKTA